MEAGYVTIEQRGASVVAELRGPLLLDTAPIVRRRLSRVVDTHPSVLVADLRHVDDIDSSGLAVLLWMHRSQVTRGCRFIVVTENSMVHRAFEVTRLYDVLDIRHELPLDEL